MLLQWIDTVTSLNFLTFGQARCHGGHSAAVPSQMIACAPWTEDCAPQKYQARSYWSANRGLRLRNWCLPPVFSNFCGLTRDFIKLLGQRPFFWSSRKNSCKVKNRKNFEAITRICGNFWTYDLFFFFGLHHTGITFSCPRAPLEIT